MQQQKDKALLLREAPGVDSETRYASGRNHPEAGSLVYQTTSGRNHPEAGGWVPQVSSAGASSSTPRIPSGGVYGSNLKKQEKRERQQAGKSEQQKTDEYETKRRRRYNFYLRLAHATYVEIQQDYYIDSEVTWTPPEAEEFF